MKRKKPTYVKTDDEGAEGNTAPGKKKKKAIVNTGGLSEKSKKTSSTKNTAPSAQKSSTAKKAVASVLKVPKPEFHHSRLLELSSLPLVPNFAPYQVLVYETLKLSMVCGIKSLISDSLMTLI